MHCLDSSSPELSSLCYEAHSPRPPAPPSARTVHVQASEEVEATPLLDDEEEEDIEEEEEEDDDDDTLELLRELRFFAAHSGGAPLTSVAPAANPEQPRTARSAHHFR